jgi:hypothetical protein
LSELSPEFDYCPRVCADKERLGEKTPPNQQFCSDCPRREAKDYFFDSCLEFLEKELGEASKKYSVKTLYAQVLDALEIEKSPPENLTVIAAQMLSILDSERARIDRIEQWNARQNQKKS